VEVNFEEFLKNLILPLVEKPEDVVVKELETNSDSTVALQVLVANDDLGRVIGKNGRIINALRTILYSCGARYGKRIEVSIDSF